jgi:hypothetical protein
VDLFADLVEAGHKLDEQTAGQRPAPRGQGGTGSVPTTQTASLRWI